MLREALRASAAGRRGVVLDEDPDVISGSLAIEAVVDEAGATARAGTPGRHVGPAVRRAHPRARPARTRSSSETRAASRHHARIVADGTGWSVEDAGSANGTFVDGAQVRRSRLDRGQILTVGDTPLRVVDSP